MLQRVRKDADVKTYTKYRLKAPGRSECLWECEDKEMKPSGSDRGHGPRPVFALHAASAAALQRSLGAAAGVCEVSGGGAAAPWLGDPGRVQTRFGPVRGSKTEFWVLGCRDLCSCGREQRDEEPRLQSMPPCWEHFNQILFISPAVGRQVPALDIITCHRSRARAFTRQKLWRLNWDPCRRRRGSSGRLSLFPSV